MEQTTVLAEAFAEPLTPERLRTYAHDLSDLSMEVLQLAFTRARRELKFFPKIAELRELAGSDREQEAEAEQRCAWDELAKFVRKYVGGDVYGSYGPQHGSYPKTFPKLSDRLVDTVRRTGGWEVYACMTEKDFPFVQKRFFEEYAAWVAVERVDASKLLAEVPRLQLIAKPMNRPRDPAVESLPAAQPTSKPKPMPQPMSEAQVRDRREMLRQQAARLLSDRKGGNQ